MIGFPLEKPTLAPVGWDQHCFEKLPSGETLVGASPISPTLFQAFAEIVRTYERKSSFLANTFHPIRKVRVEFCTLGDDWEPEPVFALTVVAPVRTVPALAAMLCQKEFLCWVRVIDNGRPSYEFQLAALEHDPASRWYGSNEAFPFVPERIEVEVDRLWTTVAADRDAFITFMMEDAKPLEKSRSRGAR